MPPPPATWVPGRSSTTAAPITFPTCRQWEYRWRRPSSRRWIWSSADPDRGRAGSGPERAPSSVESLGFLSMDQTGRSRVGAVATAATAGFLVMVVAAGAGFEGIGVPGRFFSLEPGAMAAYVVPLLRFGYLALLVVAFYRWLVTREGRSRGGARRRPPSFLATFLALVLLAGGI